MDVALYQIKCIIIMLINEVCFTVYEPCSAGQHCQNGGSCDRLEDDYRCWCSDKFAGTRCEGKHKDAPHILAYIYHYLYSNAA